MSPLDMLLGPFPRWSGYTYATHARWSANVGRKRAVARWRIRAWESNFASYASDGHRCTCAECGAVTTPRDPVFDLCRGCERQFRLDK